MSPARALAALSPALAERVLERLGFSRAPAPDRKGLAALYLAWCRAVPFDNTRKLIALRAGDPGPLPGDRPEEFLEAWLAHGAGGTCWAIHGAFCAVLEACGFPAKRGIGTMLVAPDLPPNHGTATVALDGRTWLVDACIQHGEPLALDPLRDTEVAHPAYGVRARPDSAKWLVRWRSPFTQDGMDCRIDSLDGDVDSFRTYHEQTRQWSPFNFELFARVHRRGGVVVAARGERFFFDETGAISREPLTGEARLRFLIEELGLSEALANQVPADVAMPPPPGSATAARAAGDDAMRP